MARIFRPPPPKTNGAKIFVVLIVVFGWGIYMVLFVPKKQAPSTPPKPVESLPYVEIDLRGPRYEEGRYAGWQEGLAAAEKKLSLPDAKVLEFRAEQAAGGVPASEVNDRRDFVAGWRIGYQQGWKKGSAK